MQAGATGLRKCALHTPTQHRYIVRRSSSARSRTVVSATGFGSDSTPATGLSSVPAVPHLPQLSGQRVRSRWNALALAFLGDSVWELYIRRRHFDPPKRLTNYYNSVIDEVRAESQERLLEVLEAGPFLSDEEREVVKWGGNAKVHVPKRLSKNGAHIQTYRRATALECLVGYLYLTDASRLDGLMATLGLECGPPSAACSPELAVSSLK